MQTFSYVAKEIIDSRPDSDYVYLRRDLSSLSAQEVVQLCIKLNLFISNAKTSAQIFKSQKNCLDLLLKDRYIDKSSARKLFRHISASAAMNLEIQAVNRPALLELMRWACQYGSESSSVVSIRFDSYASKKFIRSLLSCAEIYGAREIAPTLRSELSQAEKEEAFLVGMRRGGIWSQSSVDCLRQLGRARILLLENFLKSDLSYEKCFEDIYKMSVDDWMTCNVAMILQLNPYDSRDSVNSLLTAFEFDPLTFTDSARAISESFKQYIANYALSFDELKTQLVRKGVTPNQSFDFLPLLKKPILKLENGKALVIDRKLFMKCITEGPMFAIAHYQNSEEPFKRFGNACHKYSFDVAKSIVALNSLKNPSIGVFWEPPNYDMPIGDFVLGDDNFACVVEAKGVWLKDALLYENDGDDFIPALLKKYAFIPDKEHQQRRERRKGLGQLAEIIRRFADGRMRFESDETKHINNARKFVPLLVVQDALVAEPLVSKRLTKEFCKFLSIEVPPSGKFLCGNYEIFMPIVLDLDDLEYIESLSLVSPIIDLIEKFSAKAPDRNSSFSDYLFQEHRNKIRRGTDQRLVTTAAVELLDSVALKCFGHFKARPNTPEQDFSWLPKVLIASSNTRMLSFQALQNLVFPHPYG